MGPTATSRRTLGTYLVSCVAVAVLGVLATPITAHAAASTDVPEPPFGDHKARSTTSSSVSCALARDGTRKMREKEKLPEREAAVKVGIHEPVVKRRVCSRVMKGRDGDQGSKS